MATATTTSEIRAAFLEYFRAQGHEVLPSSPLVPRNDPTLLFTSAGMVQFKNIFTGQEKRSHPRATTSQKCLRAGGKHNDLENVGYTARHHTFFEMLGNFSFGDYFKEQAIAHAWTLVTREFGVDSDRLLATVYADDDEAYDLWRKISGLPEDRILRIATSDNFWAMGDTGPCGPCSELFFDHGDQVPGGPPGSPDEDGDRFVEIWNLVFMQYEQETADRRVSLPRPSIDTGMGLERMAAVMQGFTDNYDIDLFRTLIEASKAATGTDENGGRSVSHRVIADHLRASAFVIAEGVLPSNEGRGYVLRRIARRAMRHAHLLGAREPVLWKIVGSVVAEMGDAFPELAHARTLIAETLKGEETRFGETLERGMRLLSNETSKLGDGAALPGATAFQLYDTYGFPIDLTEDILRSEGRALDRAGFEAAMAEQRRKARAAWSGTGDTKAEQVWFEVRDEAEPTEFLGYAGTRAEAVVSAIVTDGEQVRVADSASGTIGVICNQTPFYAEGGGQVGDTGTIRWPDGTMTVSDTHSRAEALHVHYGTVDEGELRVGEAVELTVDEERRAGLRIHHSATHLLHAALRERLGEHVIQKGSLVAPDRLRFDISHPRAVAADELEDIERKVNGWIRADASVETRLLPPDDAMKSGALGLFGEKYGDEVRVVRMGVEAGPTFSLELCGGTHVGRTGEIGVLKIVSESALASGVRRLEAVVGPAALKLFQDHAHVLDELAAGLGVRQNELANRIERLLKERRELERTIEDLRQKLARGNTDSAAPTEIAGVRVAGRVLDGVPPKVLRGQAEELRNTLGSGLAVVVTSFEGKGSLVVAVSEDLTNRFDAVELVQAGVAALGGRKGGGRRDMAQGGGPDGAATRKALQAVQQAIGEAG